MERMATKVVEETMKKLKFVTHRSVISFDVTNEIFSTAMLSGAFRGLWGHSTQNVIMANIRIDYKKIIFESTLFSQKSMITRYMQCHNYGNTSSRVICFVSNDPDPRF